MAALLLEVPVLPVSPDPETFQTEGLVWISGDRPLASNAVALRLAGSSLPRPRSRLRDDGSAFAAIHNGCLDDRLRLVDGILVDFICCEDANAHLAVISLRELVEVQRGDDQLRLVEIALRVQVVAEVEVKVFQLTQEPPLVGSQLLLSEDDADWHATLVRVAKAFEEQAGPLEVRRDENDLLLSLADNLFNARDRTVSCKEVGHPLAFRWEVSRSIGVKGDRGTRIATSDAHADLATPSRAPSPRKPVLRSEYKDQPLVPGTQWIR